MPDYLACAPAPCGSCPYRLDTPPGVWAPEEYAKLEAYDRETTVQDGAVQMAPVRVFLCHQTNALGRETICRGWLSVHPECLAVRIGLIQREINPADVDAECPVPLYASGTEAAAAGLAGVERPDLEAVRLGYRLVEKGAARFQEDTL